MTVTITTRPDPAKRAALLALFARIKARLEDAAKEKAA